MNRPLLICLTPVLNEAWILPAFLRATSLWADYIIIADQMSTDGSREIYKQFEKVILIDNPREEMHQARTRKLLFDEAAKIKGDKILFTLDADEFLSGDFFNTTEWMKILNSEPNDVFLFRWMNLHDGLTKYSTSIHLYWALHVCDTFPESFYPDNFIHEWRLPWPKKINNEYKIDDIFFLHFARLNELRQKNKDRFYQISTVSKLDNYSGVGFYRMYHPIKIQEKFTVPNNIFNYYKKNGIELTEYIDLNDIGTHYTISVLKSINCYGIKKFAKLDIWDSDFLEINNLKDPRKWYHKLLHKYLRRTNHLQNNFIIKNIDRIIKLIEKNLI